MRHIRLFYLIKEGIRSIFKHGFMSFASVTIIVACLIIMGSFALLAVNVDNMIDYFASQNEVLAFVNEDYTEEEAKELQLRLEAIPNVSSVTFVSRGQAMANFYAEHPSEKEEGMFDDLTESVFRHRYVIYLTDIALMEQTSNDVKAIPGIDDTNLYLQVSKGFVMAKNIVSVISVILIVILFVVSVFIMNNTVKLATYSRKDEIAIMKMVGAGNFFIRFPFVVEGLILGIIGSVIAFFIQRAIYNLVAGEIMNSFAGNFIPVLPFSQLMLPVAVVFLAVGLIVGLFGSNIAIRKYLKV